MEIQAYSKSCNLGLLVQARIQSLTAIPNSKLALASEAQTQAQSLSKCGSLLGGLHMKNSSVCGTLLLDPGEICRGSLGDYVGCLICREYILGCTTYYVYVRGCMNIDLYKFGLEFKSYEVGACWQNRLSNLVIPCWSKRPP